MTFFKSLASVIFFLSAIVSFGQSTIKGEISNAQSEPLLFASILLVNAADSVFIKGTITDQQGIYVLDNVRSGNYFLVVTSVGYAKTYSRSIFVANGNTYNEDFILNDLFNALDEVLVKAKRPMYVQKPDKLVVNVHNRVTSAGNTALEVLQKVPGIFLNRQNNTLVLNGKSGVRVMINGKTVQLTQDALIQLLETMSAANIEKIELITTPSASYDAEGAAGVVNIVMKESADAGTNGSLGVLIGNRWAEALGINLNLNHRRKRSAYFFDYSLSRNRNQHFWKTYRESWKDSALQISTDTSDRKNLTTTQNLRMGSEWRLSKRSSLNLLLTAYENRWSLNAIADNSVVDTDGRVSTRMDIHEINRWQGATGSLKWVTSICADSELSIDVDYLYYGNHNPSEYENNTGGDNSFDEHESIIVNKKTPIRFLIGKVDYSCQPSPLLRFETGLKAVASDLYNEVLVERSIDGGWQSDPRFTARASLDEKIGATYFSGKYQNNHAVQISAGLRYEFTSTVISTPEAGTVLDRTYGHFFPSFFMQKSFSKERTLHFSYSRRITRPTFRDIAPFVFFWSPNTFSAGNTSLRPSISDAVKGSIQIRSWLMSLQYNHSMHEISFFQPELVEEDNTLIYRSQNLRYLNSLSLSNSYSFNIARWWEVQANVTLQYQRAETEHLVNNALIESHNFNANLINIIKLPRNFSVEASAVYNSRAVLGISEVLPLSSVNVGVQKKFNNATLQISMDDIFYDNRWIAKTDLPQMNLNSTITYDWHVQFIRLTYTWNFGNRKMKSVSIQSASEEEKGRVK